MIPDVLAEIVDQGVVKTPAGLGTPSYDLVSNITGKD